MGIKIGQKMRFTGGGWFNVGDIVTILSFDNTSAECLHEGKQHVLWVLNINLEPLGELVNIKIKKEKEERNDRAKQKANT